MVSETIPNIVVVSSLISKLNNTTIGNIFWRAAWLETLSLLVNDVLDHLTDSSRVLMSHQPQGSSKLGVHVAEHELSSKKINYFNWDT